MKVKAGIQAEGGLLKIGVNSSERYLAKLCRSTFLRLWSYPNLYRAQKWGAGCEGKEFCDHTVVFGKHVILFSDKCIGFNEKAPLQTAWKRWFKKAVWKSADQLHGAERWLREQPDKIFEDNACTKSLTTPLPSTEEMKVHRVAVARGASRACQRLLGGPGSLVVDLTLRDEQHFLGKPESGVFKVGALGDAPANFIHVFDDFSLEVVIRTVDTIADFVRYLDQRCELFLSGKLKIAEGEEELLGIYLRSIDKTGEHSFNLPNPEGIVYGNGVWSSFLASPDRKAQVEANESSYAWDRLIDHFSEQFLDGRLEYSGKGAPTDTELALRTMAAANRTQRRELAESLTEVLKKGHTHPTAARVLSGENGKDCVYVFLSFHPNLFPDHETYRQSRRQRLKEYCLVAKLKFPGRREILGIASEPLGFDNSTEDLFFLGPDSWSSELQKQAEAIKRKGGLLQSAKPWKYRVFEYPLSQENERKKGRNRNRPCSCGSGLKYKNCCGR